MVIVAVLVLAVFACLGGWLFPYTVNSWLEYADREPVIEFWHGAIVGFVPPFGQLLVPAAVVTWILMLILVG